MKKLIIYFTLAFTVIFASCDETGNTVKKMEAPVISELQNEYLIKQGALLELTPTVTNAQKATYVWTVDGKEVSNEKQYVFSATEPGEYKIILTVANASGDAAQTITVSAFSKYKYGAFVLSEGNMSNETGTLSFIDYEGIAEDSIFIKANEGKN